MLLFSILKLCCFITPKDWWIRQSDSQFIQKRLKQRILVVVFVSVAPKNSIN